MDIFRRRVIPPASHSSAGNLPADLQDGGASNIEVKEVSGRDGHTPKLEV